MGQRNVKRLYDASQAGGTPITPIAAGTGAIGTNASIPPGVGMAIVTSTAAAERVNLPLNVIGTILTIFETTSIGYELITTTVGGTINTALCDGVLAASEMNIPVAATGGAGMLLRCYCISALAWIVLPYNRLGDVEVTIVQT